MNWLPYILVGVIIGWLVELLIDYFFWRRKRICTEGERKLSGSVNSLLEENAKYRRSIVELSRRDELATNLEAESVAIKTELATLKTRLKERDTELLDLWGKVGRFGDIEASVEDLETAIENRDNEIADLRAQLTKRAGNSRGDLEAKNKEIDTLSATLQAQTAELEDLRNKLAEFGDLQASLNSRDAEITHLTALLGAAPKVDPTVEPTPDVVATTPAGEKQDDLTRIWGVGSQAKTLLQNRGIATFAQLAEAEQATIDDILDDIAPRFQFEKQDLYEAWVQQAQLINEEKRRSLKELQDQYRAKYNWDNLQKIWGIGHKAANILRAHGLSTFNQLAEANADEIDELMISSEAQTSTASVDLYQSWIDQAQFAANSAWDSFDDLQNQLRASYRQQADDLQQIWGIGPATVEILREQGITSFDDLATVEEAQLSDVLAQVSAQFNLSSQALHEAWVSQAKLAASNDWEALELLQAQISADG